MAKRPYEDLSDAQLISTHFKRDDEYTDFVIVPECEGKIVDSKKSADLAAKIDRLEEELIYRGLWVDLCERAQGYYDIVGNDWWDLTYEEKKTRISEISSPRTPEIGK